MSFPEYYNVLGVGVQATPEEIKSAYHEMVKKYHPDVNKNKKQATEKLKQINEAYGVLSNLAKRAEYDYLGRLEEESNNTPATTSSETITPENLQKATPPQPASAPCARTSAKKYHFHLALNRIILLSFFFVYIGFVYAHSDKEDPLNIIKTSDNIIESVKQTSRKINNIYQNKTWVVYLVENNYSFLVKNLPDSINLTDFYDEKKHSLLQKTQDPNMAETLINKGLDVNYRAPDGNTALLLAVKENNLPLAELLLQKGADVKGFYGTNNYSLLMLTDNPQMAELLIKHQAQINYVAKDGMSPLRLAAQKHNDNLLDI